MLADGGVGANHPAGVALPGRGVERLAHAMQTLELDGHAGVACQPPNRRQSVGVVGGELGVEARAGRDKRLGADEVGQVGRGLGGVDRIVRTAVHLRALDLAIPVGALHQPHHQPPAAGAGQRRDPLDHLRAALLVGLHRQAQAGPRAQVLFMRQPVEQLERQGEAVGLLGVDSEVDIVAGRHDREPLQARIEGLEHGRLVGRLVAGRQR